MVRENIQKAKEVNTKIYNLRSHPISKEVGQIGLIRNFALSNAHKQFSSKLAKTFLKARIRKKIG